ncbi:MAG: TonB-dependent receptor, partial [Bacteroidales bacterium]
GPWGKPVGFNGSDYMRLQTNRENTWNVALSYGIQRSGYIKSLEINAFYSDEKRNHTKNYYTAAGYRLSYTETTRFSDYYCGTLMRAVVQPTAKYTLAVGAEYYSFHISTPTDAIDYINGLSFQNRVSHNARSYITGTYLEGTYNTGRGIKLVTGLRYDHASVYEGDVHDIDRENELETFKNALSGNIAAFYRAGSHTTVRLNMARSFRMPETTELYADSYTTNGILYANSGLEPEYCHSMDISYGFKNCMVEIEVSPFIWLMNNMISKEEVKSMPGTTYRYVNIGRSRIFGGEAVASLPAKNLLKHGDKLQFRMGMAWVNGTDVSNADHYLDKGTPLDYVPPYNLKTDCSYMSAPDRKAEYTIALRMVYYSRQNRLGRDNYATPAYMVAGCSSGISFRAVKTRPEVNLTVNNLMNTKYYDYLSYLPSAGRDMRIMLTFHFD